MPEIIHVTEDRSFGGVSRLLETLQASSLGDRFEMAILGPRSALQQSGDARAFVVHNPSSWKRLALLARLARRRPVILMEHHYSPEFVRLKVRRPRRFLTMLRIAYGFATSVVAISQAQRSWMLEHGLVPKAKIEVIPPTVDLSRLLQVPRRPWYGDRRLVLGAYGRFHEQKGFAGLIRAISSDQSLDVKLRLGGFGPLEDNLAKLAQGDSRIEMVGRVSDVEGFLAETDLVVVPSLWEPYGLTCLEARAAGRPVMVSRVDALPEQVRGCGLVFGDQADLCGLLRNLRPQQLATLGAAARRSAAGCPERRIHRWSMLLQGLVPAH